MKIMKTLKISDELHRDIKIFCDKEGLKLNKWVEKQLKEKIKELYVKN